MVRLLLALALAAMSTFAFALTAFADYHEVWVVDQADAANGGDRLYIFKGPGIAPEVVPLGTAAQGVGDGAGNRAHLLLFNNAHTHGILANVATGHVYIIRASDRRIVASIDVGDQAHGAMASPDDRWILVANQNGKRLARIRADFQNEVFTYEPAADLNLGALEDPDHPDNAPICPVMYVGGHGKAYVTVRGGGMYVVDTTATPMQATRSYARAEIAPAGCGGVAVDRRVYVNSGSATSGHLHAFNAATDDLLRSIETTPAGTDAHGMAYVGNGYLWVANRGDGDNIMVIDLRTWEVVSLIEDVGPAPDLIDLHPNGNVAYVSLRGPRALTGGPSAVGQTPGVAVIAIEDGGASGRRVDFWPLGDQSPDSQVDPHGIAVRDSRTDRRTR